MDSGLVHTPLNGPPPHDPWHSGGHEPATFDVQTMAVDKLPNGRHQPFYQVMVDERDRSGSMITYVAQVDSSAQWHP